jgi:hypothetical protein
MPTIKLDWRINATPDDEHETGAAGWLYAGVGGYCLNLTECSHDSGFLWSVRLYDNEIWQGEAIDMAEGSAPSMIAAMAAAEAALKSHQIN